MPSFVAVRALVDTGASCTAVDPAVIQKLQITPSGTASVHTPSTGKQAHVCNQYDVLLAMLDPKGNPLYVGGSLPVLEAALAGQGIEALIGRDVLSLGILIFNGPNASFTLSY